LPTLAIRVPELDQRRLRPKLRGAQDKDGILGDLAGLVATGKVDDLAAVGLFVEAFGIALVMSVAY
jgi:hypothetical protein